jgi:hypothetical protein
MTLTCSTDQAHVNSHIIILRTVTEPMHWPVVLPEAAQGGEMLES